MYLGIHEKQLRFFTPEGIMVPTPEETLKSVKQENKLLLERAELAENRAELELTQQRVYKLAAKLRELGIDPNSL